MRRTQEGYSPFKDDKPKDTENSLFEASSVLVVKATIKHQKPFGKEHQMNNTSAPIGVFDSGLGGISVLKELYALMPDENYIYFGDTKNAPYGGRSDSEILTFSTNVINELIQMGAKAVVIACNTATSIAADILRSTKNIPIIGIEPAVKPAAIKYPGGKILVMATQVTLKKDKFNDLVKRYESTAQITPLPCPGLVELIEKGEKDSDEIKAYLKNLLMPFSDEHFDGVVLGCTHYPHIKKQIRNTFDYDIEIFDGAEGTARETMRRLCEEGLRNTSGLIGTIEFVSSLKSDEEIQIMKNFYSK